MIHAAEQFNGAVGKPARAVAGAIQTRGRIVLEGVAHEFSGRQFRPIEITARQTVAADE